MTDSDLALITAAQKLVHRLHQLEWRIVFAESCTAGLLAATMGRFPGVSDVLCGSAVTYRNRTKNSWLQVDMNLLDDPHIGPVSDIVSRQMAWGVLQNSPEADLAVSVTGHLGPHAPAGYDGVVFSGICLRGDEMASMHVNQYDLPTSYPQMCDEVPLRICRQEDLVLRIFNDTLKALPQ